MGLGTITEMIDAATAYRDLINILPLWVRLGNFLLILPGFSFFLIINSIWVWKAKHSFRETDLHWTERARKTFSFRREIGVFGAFFVVYYGFRFFVLSSGPIFDETRIWGAWTVSATFFCALLFASFRLTKERLGQAYSLKQFLKDLACDLGLRAYPFLFAAIIFSFGPKENNLTNLSCFLIIIAAFLFTTLRGSFLLLKKVGLLVPASQAIQDLSHQCAKEAAIKLNEVCELRWSSANAFAFIFSDSIALTTRFLETSPIENIRAILFHEFGHLAESRMEKVLRIVPSFLFVILSFYQYLKNVVGENKYFLFLALSLVVIFALRLRSLRLEKKADAFGARFEKEKGAYAKALERIYEVNLIPAVLGRRRGTHPHLYDRLLASGYAPDYPRPKAPSFWRARLPLLLLFSIIFLESLIPIALKSSAHKTKDGVLKAELLFLSDPRKNNWMSSIGYAYEIKKDFSNAIRAYRAALALDPDDVILKMALLRVLTQARNCDIARKYLASIGAKDFSEDEEAEDLMEELQEIRSSLDNCSK